MDKSGGSKFIEVLILVLRKIVFILYLGIVGMAFIQVIFRYLLNSPIFWAEELTRYLFIWSIFLTAAMGLRDKIHVSIDVITDLFPEGFRKILAKITDIISLVFMAILVKVGFDILQINMFQPSPALRIPIGLIYMSIPVGYALMIIIKIFGTKWGEIK